MDTVHNSKDSITSVIKDSSITIEDSIIVNLSNETTINLKNESTVTIPDTLNIKTPEPSKLENTTNWFGIAAAVGTVVIAFFAVLQFFKNKKRSNELNHNNGEILLELRTHTEELKKQNKILERKNRLKVMPRLWSNVGGGVNGQLKMSLDNRGELCFYDGYEILDGDQVEIQRWNQPQEIQTNRYIYLTAPMPNKPLNEISFIIKVFYHDQDNNLYETVFEFIGGAVKLIETIEK